MSFRLHPVASLTATCLATAAIATSAAAQTYTTSVIARGLQRPTGIRTDARGTVWFTELPQPGVMNGNNTVSRLDPTGPTVLVMGEPEPTNLALGPSGELWWTCKSAGVIVRFANNQKTVVLRNLNRPSGIAVGGDGTVYFTEVPTPGVNGMNGGRNRVLSWTMAGGMQTLSMGEPEPVDVAVDGQDNLYWTCRTAGVILRRDAKTQTTAPLLRGLDMPTGIDTDAAGDVYFTEVPTPGTPGSRGGRNRITRYRPADRTLRLIDFGDPQPTDVSAAADGGAVYWTCTSAGVIVRADRGGMPVTLSANGDARPGHTVPLLLAASGLGGSAYVAGTSMGLGPIALGEEVLALSLDPLLMATIGGAPGFAGYMGLLDPLGRASAAFSLPNLATLRGITLYTAYVVVDLRGPTPLLGTSDTLRLVVQ